MTVHHFTKRTLLKNIQFYTDIIYNFISLVFITSKPCAFIFIFVLLSFKVFILLLSLSDRSICLPASSSYNRDESDLGHPFHILHNNAPLLPTLIDPFLGQIYLVCLQFHTVEVELVFQFHPLVDFFLDRPPIMVSSCVFNFFY